MRVVIIGASGHGLVLADVIQICSQFKLVGFLDSNESAALTRDLPGPVIGSPNDIVEFAEKFRIKGFFLGIGDNYRRRQCWDAVRARLPEAAFPALVHPMASISPSAKLSQGTVVLAGAVVGTMAKLGCGVLLNTLSNLDHHGEMAPFSSLAPGAHTGGCVTVGEYSAVSLGANVLHGKTIGSNSIVGAGALVTTDIPDNVTAYGVPARIIRKRNLGEKYL